jgi:hypothetical protein
MPSHRAEEEEQQEEEECGKGENKWRFSKITRARER